VPTYDRSEPTALRSIDLWDDGVGWIAHPEEDGRRASHAVRADDGGVWVFDPLDAPGVDELLADLGPVRGVVVCAGYHARDAEAVARRHDAPVYAHRSLGRVEEQVDVPIERFDDRLGAFEATPLRPLYAWRETALYRERDGTLYVPDFLSSHPTFTAGDERVGMPSLSRLRPPTDHFGSLAPDRILFGHGEGILEDATSALDETLSGARRQFPRALVGLPGELRAMLGAVR